MIISREDVEWLVTSARLISPFDKGRMGPCSYDLAVGAEFYCYSSEDGEKFVTRRLPKGDADAACHIPPNGCAFVMSEETLNIPVDLVGHIALRFALTKEGYMLSPQAPIDPGYSGKVMMLLYNLSDEYRTLRRGEPFVTVFFQQLSTQTEPYKGRNQSGVKIGDFMKRNTPIRSSLSSMQTNVEQATAQLERDRTALNSRVDEALARASGSRAQTLFMILGASLAAATLIVTLLTVYVTIRPLLQPGVDAPSGSSTVPTSSATATPTPSR